MSDKITKILPCPFCDIGPFGSVAWGIPYAECRTVDCAMFGKCVPLKQWNHRSQISEIWPLNCKGVFMLRAKADQVGDMIIVQVEGILQDVKTHSVESAKLVSSTGEKASDNTPKATIVESYNRWLLTDCKSESDSIGASKFVKWLQQQ